MFFQFQTMEDYVAKISILVTEDEIAKDERMSFEKFKVAFNKKAQSK